MNSTGSKVSAALLIGLIAIAAAIYFSPTSQSPSTPSYKGYEPVVSEWFALSGKTNVKIKHLTGPFYAVRYTSFSHPGKSLCLMMDVSKEYKGDADSYDRFWWTGGGHGPAKGDRKAQVCDF